jgi:hypothetical protein
MNRGLLLLRFGGGSSGVELVERYAHLVPPSSMADNARAGRDELVPWCQSQSELGYFNEYEMLPESLTNS